MTSSSPFLVSHTVSGLSVLWHLARSSAPIMLNYRQNMELGHCGQATAIIKPRGVAEIHRRRGARPCPQPRRVAFKGAISFTPRIFITVYSKFLVKQMNSKFYEWVTFTLPINSAKKAGTAQRRKSPSTERGNKGKQRRGTVIRPPGKRNSQVETLETKWNLRPWIRVLTQLTGLVLLTSSAPDTNSPACRALEGNSFDSRCNQITRHITFLPDLSKTYYTLHQHNFPLVLKAPQLKKSSGFMLKIYAELYNQ